ncbi:hypothetical protein SAMN02745127_00757 [Oceanospirillum multiglobuliferum]|uniref:Uncharacterized protein n=1 Tax=Oceanospirillum multiglobuliferum TaxID=64969 RepID=A0A1T4MBR5_9GAMM|nr:hypothetical protein [Oceanospirillum multiglobuliferum]OPX56160.1 hypothetical protein BTE48_04035 [Oceanospirillum multiglobuliferum]SJZ64392.1 hypothetical protein SAMN02745127_00757 [Oceanospirillum multiglobuliferum]
MAGKFRPGARRTRTPKLQGKGVLESITTEGPFQEWLGMPELYRHTLVVDAVSYSYQTEDPELSVALGDVVVFRYKEAGKALWIDRNSLGVWIDPATFSR